MKTPVSAAQRHTQALRRRYLAHPSPGTRTSYLKAKRAVFGHPVVKATGAHDVSPAGLAFIAREEGTVLHPYNDSRGFATVGVGHLIAQRPVGSADLAKYARFTQADALALLRKDAGLAVDAVHRFVKVRLSQHQFDALVSLVFNIGVGNFASSTVLRKLNAGDYRGAADALRMWHVGGAGLAARRERERTLFLS